MQNGVAFSLIAHCAWLIALFAAGPAQADLTVSLAGVIATQAILSYSAPDGNPCTIQVSEQSSLNPPVHDVDPAIFPGADKDNRPGSLSIGQTRIVVIGKRAVEISQDGHSYSRALQAYTIHHYKITCGSEVGQGQFTTSNIPAGSGYADPIPINPANDGTYVYPTFSTTDRTSSAIDPHTGALVKNMVLPGDLNGGVSATMGSSGIGVMCHPTPVKASNEEKYGYHCQITLAGAMPGLFWIAPDGETRFLGVMRTNYNPPAWGEAACTGSLSAPFDADDPNTFYCTAMDTTDTKRIIVKGVYSGHSVSGQDADLTNQTISLQGMPHTTFTQVMPEDRDLNTLLVEFDPKYTTYGLPCCSTYRSGDWANGKFFFYLWGASQDTFGWIAEYDPQQTAAMQQAKFGSAAGCVDNPAVTGSTYAGEAGCVVASAGTFTGGEGSGFRWSTLHTMDLTPASSWLPVTLNALKMKGNAYYQVTLASALSDTPDGCTMTQPPGSTIADWPDSSWAYGCSTMTVNGDPALVGTHPGYPAFLPALPGDLLSVDSGGYNHHEVIRLLDKGADENTWYVQRQYYYHIGCSLWPYSSVAVNGTLDMLSPAVYPNCNTTGMQVWWNPDAGALNNDGATVIMDPLPQSHPAYINNALYGRWTYINGTAMAGGEPERLLNPPARIPMNAPSFDGIGPTALETHPSLSVSNPPDEATYKQVVDGRPYYGNTALVTAANVTLVGGQLYRIRGTSVAGNYKRIAYFANSGSRAMTEASGPSAKLTTDSSTQFQWCAALKAGECYGGSQPGDLYFNAPGIVNAYCTSNWLTLQTKKTIPNDICVSPSLAVTQAVTMQEIADDPLGLQLRVISNSLSKYDQQSVFWNARTLPDASWLFTSLAADSTIKLIKVPPLTAADNVNRTTFVPVTIQVSSVPVGATNVVAEFGYVENGDSTNFYCTSRKESCIVNSSSITVSTPFYYAQTETYSGLFCAGGCTLALPGIPQRMVYYRIHYRNVSGQDVAVSATYVAATDYPMAVLTPPLAPTSLSVNPSSMSFSGTAGGANPGNQSLQVQNTGTAAMNWSAAGSASWLNLSSAGGSLGAGGNQSVAVSASLTGLAAGVYQDTVTVTAPGAAGSPALVPVTLTVSPSLNWPAFVRIDEILTVNYGSLPVAQVEWDFVPVASGASAQAVAALSQNAPETVSFPTISGAMIPARQGLTLGTYQATVKFLDASGALLTSAGPQTITFVSADLSGVKVYPNPWRSDRHAAHPSITFDDLTVGTTIKIFTVAGHETKELQTDGPKIAWDLANDSGDKVASGIYLYLITDLQGDKVRGKLAVIK